MRWFRVENLDLRGQDIAIHWEMQEIRGKTQATRGKVLKAAREEFLDGRRELVDRRKTTRTQEHS